LGIVYDRYRKLEEAAKKVNEIWGMFQGGALAIYNAQRMIFVLVLPAHKPTSVMSGLSL